MKRRIQKLILPLLVAAVLMSFGILPGNMIRAASADVWDGSSIAAFTAGTGVYDNPYEIATGAQLAYLAQQVNASVSGYDTAYYVLTDDIDLNNIEWTPVGSDPTYFEGNFDGGGHTVSRLSITSSTKTRGGLFGNVAGATIKNLGIEDVAINISTSSARIGGLAGQFVASGSTASTVFNCYTTGSVVGPAATYAGGLTGYANGDPSDATEFINCFSTANIVSGSASARVGGLVAEAGNTVIMNCYAAGNVSSANSTRTGGILGRNVSATLTYAYWNSDASQTISTGAQTPKKALEKALTTPLQKPRQKCCLPPLQRC